MTRKSEARSLALLLAPCLVLSAVGRPAPAQVNEQPPMIAPACPHCANGAQACPHCGSRFSFLHRKTCVHVSHKRICAPCGLKNYGYYPHCWHPWPFPTDYSHCPPPVPPAAFQPPWYEPGNPHPPKADELPTPTPTSPDMKEEPEKPNGDKKKDEDTKKKDDTEKPKQGQPQTRLLPPLKGTLLPSLTNYNLSGK
jgi:hypothetical protein